MKKLVYKVNKDKEISIYDYKGEPYLLYRENECGIYLETALEDEEINELKGNIELLHLPDDILLGLGINVSEDETLEEICERLNEEGIECKFKNYEDDECGYTEEIMINLKERKKVKVIIIEDKKQGSRRVKIEKAQKAFLRFTYNPPKRILEVVIDGDQIKDVESLDMKAILKKMLGEEVDPEDVVSILELAEERFDKYTFNLERNGERIRWKLSLSS